MKPNISIKCKKIEAFLNKIIISYSWICLILCSVSSSLQRKKLWFHLKNQFFVGGGDIRTKMIFHWLYSDNFSFCNLADGLSLEWGTPSFLKSPELFSVFYQIFTMLCFGWSWFFLWFPIPLVFCPSLSGSFHEHQLQAESLTHSTSLARSRFSSIFSFIITRWSSGTSKSFFILTLGLVFWQGLVDLFSWQWGDNFTFSWKQQLSGGKVQRSKLQFWIFKRKALLTYVTVFLPTNVDKNGW